MKIKRKAEIPVKQGMSTEELIIALQKFPGSRVYWDLDEEWHGYGPGEYRESKLNSLNLTWAEE